MSISPQPWPPSRRRILVLVVDADSRVRSALRATLSSEPDLEVIAAVADESAALSSAAEVPRAVALVDVSPASDETLRLVRLLSRRPGWQVVAMSVHSSARTGASAAGAIAFVVKGDAVETVLSAIRAAAADG